MWKDLKYFWFTSFRHTKKDKMCLNFRTFTGFNSKSSCMWEEKLKLGMKPPWAEWCPRWFLTIDLFMWKHKNIITHNYFFWSPILFVKETPDMSIPCLDCKEHLWKLHQTRSQTAGQNNDHTGSFKELVTFTRWWTYQSLHPMERMIQSWNPKILLYLLSFPEDPVLPEEKSNLPEEAHSSASTLLVNLLQRLHCHFSADRNRPQSKVTAFCS